MNKLFLLPIMVLGSVLLMPSVFADTSTGSTSTGSTSTGTINTNTGITNTGAITNTGVTATGSTNTGTTTATGVTQTGILNCGTGIAMDSVALQEAYITELTRLLAEKKNAYQAAMSLTGVAKVEAIKAANGKFRAGQKIAIAKMNLAKKENKLSRKICKKLNDDNKPRHSGDDERLGHDSNDDDNDNNRQRGKDKDKSPRGNERGGHGRGHN